MSWKRRCLVLCGARADTRARALALVAGLEPERVLWVAEGDGEPPGATAPGRVRRLLGGAFDAVVLDLTAGLDADLLGQCEGFVWGGGALVLRLPPSGEAPAGPAALAAPPFLPEDVTGHFWRRLLRVLARHGAGSPDAAPLVAPPRATTGTAEQRAVVDALTLALAGPAPTLVALVSDRGRGKSSALGLALSRLSAGGQRRIAVTAPSEEAAAEVFRFAGEGAGVRFVAPEALAFGEGAYDAIIVDEAAQLPVPLLTALTQRHQGAPIAFATTARGYEGTGNGFLLRFLAWARRQTRPFVSLRLTEPIRYSSADPLEALVFDALALDAEPAAIPDGVHVDPAAIEAVSLDRAALADDERSLRQLFGLLVHAHYRTTPSDLHRALDAPNLALHALLHRGDIVAACLVAKEGGLAPSLCDAIAHGRTRVRGHALAETLVWHCGHPEAGGLSMLRSVRIAVHPSLRRQGLATRLVEHLHERYDVDLFGTLFGATPELIGFRRALGYDIVRVGVSRGARTGEPAAAMVRPVSPRAAALFADLRRDLAEALPAQLELLAREGPGQLSAELSEALCAGLPAPAPLEAGRRRRAVAHYLTSPQPYEVAAFALRPWVVEHERCLAHLGARSAALVKARVLEGLCWADAAAAAGFEGVPSAMRELRRALRALAARAEPGLFSP